MSLDDVRGQFQDMAEGYGERWENASHIEKHGKSAYQQSEYKKVWRKGWREFCRHLSQKSQVTKDWHPSAGVSVRDKLHDSLKRFCRIWNSYMSKAWKQLEAEDSTDCICGGSDEVMQFARDLARKDINSIRQLDAVTTSWIEDLLEEDNPSHGSGSHSHGYGYDYDDDDDWSGQHGGPLDDDSGEG